MAEPTVTTPTGLQDERNRGASWVLPLVVGVVALVVGLGAGFAIGSGSAEGKSETRSTSGQTRADLDERETKLAEMADTLDERQDALVIEEKKVAEDTISGDGGTLIVGEDVKKGRYRAVEASDTCLWVTYSNLDSSTESEIDSALGPGQMLVTLTDATKILEVNGCPDFRKID